MFWNSSNKFYNLFLWIFFDILQRYKITTVQNFELLTCFPSPKTENNLKTYCDQLNLSNVCDYCNKYSVPHMTLQKNLILSSWQAINQQTFVNTFRKTLYTDPPLHILRQ